MLLEEKHEIASLLSVYQASKRWVREDYSLITQGCPNPKDFSVY